LNTTKFSSNRAFTLNEPNAPRLNAALAREIGLNESLLFLQLEFWIAISDNERDGRRWTYQSVADIQQKAFDFLSTKTIERAINSLIERGLVIKGKYNKKSYDRTNWYAINYEEANKLRSITVESIQTKCLNGDRQNVCIDTDKMSEPIPETTTENKTETTNDLKHSPFSFSDHAMLEDQDDLIRASDPGTEEDDRFDRLLDQHLGNQNDGKEKKQNQDPLRANTVKRSRGQDVRDGLFQVLGTSAKVDEFLNDVATPYLDQQILCAASKLRKSKNVKNPFGLLKKILESDSPRKADEVNEYDDLKCVCGKPGCGKCTITRLSARCSCKKHDCGTCGGIPALASRLRAAKLRKHSISVTSGKEQLASI